MKGKELELVYGIVAGLATYNQLGSVVAALAVSFLMILVIVAVQMGWVQQLLGRVDWRSLWRNFWHWLRPQPAQSAVPLGHIPLAQDLDTDQWIFADIAKLQSVGVFAKRGQGKTATVDALLYEIITRCQPDGRHGVQLAILDPKRVDYDLYNRLPHLAIPIAQNKRDFSRALQWAADEMDRRAELFKSFPGRKCNDTGRYHRLLDEYGRDDLPELPHLFVLVEEAQEVTTSKEDEARLETLLKVGRAFGVNVWLLTQRNTAVAISNDVQSQLSTRFIGYMAGAATDLKRIGLGDIPGHVIEFIQEPKPGHFALEYNGQWHRVYVPMITDRELERAVKEVSRKNQPEWPGAETTTERQKLTGSKREKETAVKQWFLTLIEKPTIEEFMERFDVGKNTASKWISELWL